MSYCVYTIEPVQGSKSEERYLCFYRERGTLQEAKHDCEIALKSYLTVIHENLK